MITQSVLHTLSLACRVSMQLAGSKLAFGITEHLS